VKTHFMGTTCTHTDFPDNRIAYVAGEGNVGKLLRFGERIGSTRVVFCVGIWK